ncbi:MAG: sulfotransferase family protein [Gallionellaceae bacterium]
MFEKTLQPLSGPRYFGIGFNKTGTTSLGRSFLALGLTPVAEPRSPHMDFRQLASAIFDRGDFQPALHAASYFRSFQDRPWNVWDIFRHLDEKFPGSYFILTERDPENWWNSVEKWLTISHKYDKAKHLRYLQHLKAGHLEKRLFVDSYERYNDAVKTYFIGRSNLLVMNLEAGDGWDKLCSFLDLPVPDIDFPHANKQLIRTVSGSRLITKNIRFY